MAKKKTQKKINIDQILLKNRQLFLFGSVDDMLAEDLIETFIALDRINHKPITLWINSRGGSVRDGFAIIDTMKKIKSPVITIVSGEACSMAGIISVAGNKKYITENSIWMSHDMAGGIGGDYTSKVLDRAKYLKKEQKKLFIFLKQHTKLSEKDLNTARVGELWFDAEDCKARGIVDEIIK